MMQIVLWAFLVISNMELKSKTQVSASASAEKYAMRDAAILAVRLDLFVLSSTADTHCLRKTNGFWQLQTAGKAAFQ